MPISGNITAFVGRHRVLNSGEQLLILWNYGYRKMIAIEVVGMNMDWTVGGTDYFEQSRYQDELTHQCMGKVQALLNTINFEREDSWGYMIDRPSGPRIIQKSKELYRIPCDFLWAPRADMSEIEMYSFHYSGQGTGRAIWRGKKVDVMIACDESGLRLVERETRGLKAVQGMDITFDIVAHLFRGDLLVGILTEPSHWSRGIKIGDRAAICAAYAKLERAFIVQGFVNSQTIVVDENSRVRIMDLHSFIYHTRNERKRFEENAQKYHWDSLSEVFGYLAPVPAGFGPRAVRTTPQVLATIPPPEHLLLVALDFLVDDVAALFDGGKGKRGRKKTSTRGNSKILHIGSLTKASQPHSRAVTTTSPHGQPPPPPYSRSPLPHERLVNRRLMLAPASEDFDTNGTGASIVEV
ncbi:hypothetical protein B0H17DRAFT_1049426 [Mycena rosella]|uniref:Uncharacterized protein n=1 Tax=Mycena rosella TaxID=1033263 RepID=A0AAD7GKS1_MYCRO|nr:hypothetical protein B0H17DRAFT_1049426 [Mycena rosella]